MCAPHGTHSNYGKTIVMAYFGSILALILVMLFIHFNGSNDFLEKIGVESKQKKLKNERG